MKVSLSTITAGYGSTAALNANFAAIQAALELCLWRDGTSPNAMSAPLDMNSQRIINLPAPTSDNEPVRYIDLVAMSIGGQQPIPTQTGQSGKYLTTNGSVLSWGSLPGNTATSVTFTPTGNIAAVNVQAALAEVDSEKQVVIAATGMLKGSGGGTVVAATAGTDYVKPDTATAFTGSQRGTYAGLSSVANSIAVNLASGNNFSHIFTENTTLAAPTNVVAGQSGVILLFQQGTPRTLAYNSFWKFSGGNVPSVTPVANAFDVLCYVVDSNGTKASCVLLKDIQ